MNSDYFISASYLSASLPNDPMKIIKAFTRGLDVKVLASADGGIPYLLRFASLNMITKYSSASRCVTDSIAFLLASRV
jgi:hypothetical protein